ncbi:asparagine synthase C-terminal domain-containing protein, partial [Alphaproteobacteria bacterium]|nr:asparagine synthase C-terminal domain-containing protein [Alphaproteobacteria bacterium]
LKKVQPGEIIKFGLNNSLSKKKYFNHSNEFIRNKKTRFNKEILAETDKIINESIRERLVADVPVGIFLSGGLDSSLIAAIASKYQPNINCFTLKFDNASYDESHYANLVTNNLKIKHNIFNINKKNLIKEWDNLNFYLDEPINDSSMLPTYILSKKSSDYVKVALTGDGCDELFAGYINFKSIFLSKLTQKIKEDSYIDKAFKSLIDKLPNSYEYMNKKFLLKQFSKTFGKNENLHSLYAMSSFSGNELKRILNTKIDEKLIFEEIDILNNFNKDKLSALENLQLQFLSFYLPDNILTKSDRSSMYNSIELRSPFLSNKLSKMSFNIEFNSKLKKLYF